MIPEMTDPLGKHWDQPERESITIAMGNAYMCETAFEQLHEYSCSIPTAVYVGKMWKRYANGDWWLLWFDECEDEDYVATISKQIIITDKKKRKRSKGWLMRRIRRFLLTGVKPKSKKY